MQRTFLAALLSLVMVLSMIPVSASAADYVESSQNGYFTITYDNRVIDRTLTVNMKDVEGNLLDSLTVNNVQAADAAIQIALTPAHKNEYNIACVEIANGTQTLLNVSNDVCSFRTTVSSAATVTVILCKQPNIEGEEIDPGYGTIQYRAYEPALLKLLKSNDIRVDKNTIIEDIAFDFIGEYVDDDYDFSYTPTGANNLAYFHAILSNAGCRATPNNIKSLVITYSQNGNEQSIAIPSEKLRYVSENGIYKIEANDDSIFVVAFYYEAGAELTTWSLYDVRFVDTGTALGSENMPADPTYGDGNTYIFTNWDKNVGGGDPFLPYEEVLDDTVVYAQKTSSPGRGGTEIHVMNTDNELANRIMEIYNAENDTQLGSNSIDMDSVTIYATSKDGKTTTNHNYWNNGWRPLTGGNQYYRVINSDIAGDHPTISNDHIAHDNIGSITINATVNDTPFTVTLPVDETVPGAVSVSLVQDNIIEISVNGAPTAPTDDDLTGDTGLLGEGAVKVTCTNEAATHEPEEQTYGLLDGYTPSDVQWTGDGETGYYYVDITVPAAGYVTKFSIDSGADHALALDAAATDTIRLQYSNEGWKVMDEETPVTFEVTCTTDQPGGGDEPTPTPTPNPGPDPDPDPDPDPIPTPTPDPGDDDNPPYIPPVDPDDSGVSDLLNTDDHIQYLFGYPEGTFGPENNMTRAEVAQMFYNLLLDQDVTITKTFDDVPANAWYAKAVNTLASLGVVSGVGNGDFEPERSITRAEFTSIAMKFAEGKTGGTNIFSDVKSTDWFYRAVVNSTQYGWIHGYGDGTFRPNNPITRVEVTAIVNNMLGREADVDFVTEHYDELNHFSDLAVSHWGYYHIVEATNDHDYTKPSSGENWTELN